MKYVKKKSKKVGTFYKFYKEEYKLTFPILVIGGNNEDSKFYKTLFYGGYIAHNIYYMGASNVIMFKGLRIVGISGMLLFSSFGKLFRKKFENKDFYRIGHYENAPFNDETIRSVYQTREYEVMKLSLIQDEVDIFISHETPRIKIDWNKVKGKAKNIKSCQYSYENGDLGQIYLNFLMDRLSPKVYVCSHLHIQYSTELFTTKGNKFKYFNCPDFLDERSIFFVKATKKNGHFQFEEFNPISNFSPELLLIKNYPLVDNDYSFYYDSEWMAITKITNPLLIITKAKADYSDILSNFPLYIVLKLNSSLKADYEVFSKLLFQISEIRKQLKNQRVFDFSKDEIGLANKQSLQFIELLKIEPLIFSSEIPNTFQIPITYNFDKSGNSYENQSKLKNDQENITETKTEKTGNKTENKTEKEKEKESKTIKIEESLMIIKPKESEFEEKKNLK